MTALKTVVAAALLLVAVASCSTSSNPAVDKAEAYCKAQVSQNAGDGDYGDGSDKALFEQRVDDAFDACFDLRVSYYNEHPNG